jgi:hypothetical protein
MRLGVEVNQTSVNNTTLNPLPNQIYKIHNISIIPKASRDLYEFRLNSVDTYTLNVNLANGSTKKVSLSASMTAENFRTVVGAFSGEE